MLLAKIREIDCIGCGKCLDACPVDAILGAPKFMHTVLDQECIGCKLCVAPCPMDCIELIEAPLPSFDTENSEKSKRAEHAKMRYRARTLRLIKKERKMLPLPVSSNDPLYKKQIQLEIEEAIQRAEERRKSMAEHGNGK